MSTFNGLMPEFPDIRIDYFHRIPDHCPPLACFLSHVHSDHLAGLEILKSPFVYCSAATKEILLRLERYPHRLNFALGTLEQRKQQYTHLKNLLKPIPLETPTRIELEPKNVIQVTLFDANHCTGAVMFLIEDESKAVLYTGDVRSEPWFVNNLTRNPFLIEYTSSLKQLDCIYLDTSNTGPTQFPTKAEGVKELLQKISKYPPDTVFHFTAWTFGYEEVWMALSRALKSQIHVDNYKLRLYRSLSADSKDNNAQFMAHDAPVLAGYQCGNGPQVGCLTDDINVRVHSCEKGMQCKTIDKNTVFITPIITRYASGEEIEEVGIGGGGGDLTNGLELELDDASVLDQLLNLFTNNNDPLIMAEIGQTLRDVARFSGRSLSLKNMGLGREKNGFRLTDLARVIARSAFDKQSESRNKHVDEPQTCDLPRTITFPYSRHSSYAELCHLVKVFNPKDVYPCTVDEGKWTEDVSMFNLFSNVCSVHTFRHDEEMRKLHPKGQSEDYTQQSQTTVRTEVSDMLPPSNPLHRTGESPRLAHSKALRRDSQGKLRLYPLEDEMQPSNSMAMSARAEHASTTSAGTKILTRNSQGQLRLYSNENDSQAISGMAMTRRVESASTPPREIIAASPGSASQNSRRKAILEGLGQERAKRPRLQYAGPSSQESPETREDMVMSLAMARMSPCRTQIDEFEVESEEEPAISDQQFPEFSAFRDRDGGEITVDTGDHRVHDRQYILLSEVAYWDYDDNVHRCRFCSHEWWRPVWGFCTNCFSGQTGIPYFEVLLPGCGAKPAFEPNENGSHEDRTDYEDDIVVGWEAGDIDRVIGADEYLDVQSSAYDSQDEASDFHEEYEINSFINDSDEDTSDDEDGTKSDDGEPGHRALEIKLKESEEKNARLQGNFDRLLNDYGSLYDDFKDFRRDMLGSDYESSTYDGDGDHEGILHMPVNILEPVLAEVVLSREPSQSQSSDASTELASLEEGWENFSEVAIVQAQDQPQGSAISPERVKRRVEGYQAAEGSHWHNISLVSTTDNHTHAEVEL